MTATAAGPISLVFMHPLESVATRCDVSCSGHDLLEGRGMGMEVVGNDVGMAVFRLIVECCLS